MAQSTIDLPIVNLPDEEPAGRALRRGVRGGSRVCGARPNQGRRPLAWYRILVLYRHEPAS